MIVDKRLVVTGAALLVVTMAATGVARLSLQTPHVPSVEEVSDVEKEGGAGEEAPSPEPPADYLYLIREYQGRVAVFIPGEDEPELILDVMVKYLPDYDRAQMEEGIPVENYNRLVSLLEDYTS